MTMATEPYTPDEAELIGCYAGAMEEQAGENYATAKADAERGIAKIKADAVREVADDLYGGTPSRRVPTWSVNRSIRVLADRIEIGDRQ